ncbi:MAG: hypothetical protein ACK55I_02780, partial [bacterium]
MPQQVEIFDRDENGRPRRRDRGVTVPLGDFLGDAWTDHVIRSGSRDGVARTLVWLRDVNDALREPLGFGRLKALATRAAR